MRQILITGADSYIGTSFEKWMKQYDEYIIDCVSTRDGKWRDKDFSEYDVVFHVAGIAHVDTGYFRIRHFKKLRENKELYYRVNKDLTIDIARKAKKEGVKQFIFISSIIVYGEHYTIKKPQYITKDTVPKPTNYYGKSKLLAERELERLESEDFKVVILRPPMIYGKGCKGNYQKLAKFARITPIFPDMENRRSMLYVDNLCEFVRLVVVDELRGIFYPQNSDYIKTSDLIKVIANCHGRRIILFKTLNLPIYILSKISKVISRLINKIFGCLMYDKYMSQYTSLGNYQLVSFLESIELTEKQG